MIVCVVFLGWSCASVQATNIAASLGSRSLGRNAAPLFFRLCTRNTATTASKPHPTNPTNKSVGQKTSLFYGSTASLPLVHPPTRRKSRLAITSSPRSLVNNLEHAHDPRLLSFTIGFEHTGDVPKYLPDTSNGKFFLALQLCHFHVFTSMGRALVTT